MLLAGARVGDLLRSLAGGPAVKVSGNGPMALEACGGLLLGALVLGLSPAAQLSGTDPLALEACGLSTGTDNWH